MAADLLSETRLPLHDAPRHPLLQQGRRPGRPVHRATIERWRTRGVRGVRLETTLVGGIRVTSVEAVRRFLDRINGHVGAGPTPSEVLRQHEASERELEAIGL